LSYFYYFLKILNKMANKISYMTREGYEKLKSELDDLRTVERQKVARQIAEAREKGDLSENAEYDAAKEAQGLLELKIKQMEEVLANARVVNESDLDSSKVVILTTIKLKNLKTKKDLVYTLVSETEADLKAGRISVNSPIGQGLLGKSKGDVVNIQTPGGSIQLEILDISINL
jgi:transcription elongation factor GreA